jgi:transcriptional regulator with XRE-family HTH domain
MSEQKLPIIGTEEITEILNTTRERHGITSDEKLARYLGVSDQAIYRWRRGQIDKSARILVTLTRQLLQPASS